MTLSTTRGRRLLAWLACSLLAAPAAAAPGDGGGGDRVPTSHTLISEARAAHGWPDLLVPGAAIVKLAGEGQKPFLDEAGRAALLKDLEARTAVRLERVMPGPLGWSLYRIRDLTSAAGLRAVPTEAETRALIEKIGRDPAVAGASVDGWNHALLTPNDPGLNLMWHLELIDAEGAWNITTGSATQRVGVVDTGVWRTHEDLVAKDIAGYDFISDPALAEDGNGRDPEYQDEGDGGNCGGQQQPDSWHGTHVSGTILASANNGKGIPGVNWGAGLVMARGLGLCGTGDTFDIMTGAAWLAGYDWTQDAQNPLPIPPLAPADKVSVMNLSLGRQDNCSGFEQSVIDYANNVGTIFVAAAGNDNSFVGSPGNCDGAIAVGAYGPTKNKSSFSNIGPEIAVFAPGGDGNQQDWVLSTYGGANDNYEFLPGTSMASPHVAGAVSLMLDLNPSLTRDAIVGLFDQGETCGSCQGFPTLELYSTLAAVTPGEDPPPEEEDALEENDTVETATPLACGSDLDLFANDPDIFALTLPTGTDLDVVLTPTGAGDIDMAIYDDVAANPLKASTNADQTPEEVAVTSTGAPLTLLVVPWFNEQTGDDNHGPYHLTVICTDPVVTEPDPTPDPEPGVVVEPDPSPDVGVEPDPSPDPGPVLEVDNPDLARAWPVVCGDHLRFSVDEESWFLVEVADYDSLLVSTEADAERATVAIVSRGGHTVIAQSSESGLTQTARADLLGAGTYAVRVRAPEGPTDYTLDVGCQSFEPDEGAGFCSHAATSSAVPWGAGLVLGLLGLVARRRRRS